MSQIKLAIRHTPQSELLFRWQAAVSAAFAGGSLSAALLNLGALITLSIARFALSRFAIVRRPAKHPA